MSKKVLIGLCGYSGSGKTEVAKLLKEKFDFAEFAFADRVKETVSNVFDINLNDCYNNDCKSSGYYQLNGKNLREVFQIVGTTMRKINPNVWVQNCFRWIDLDLTNVVISDVRYPNEVEAILKANGILIGIKRPKTGHHLYKNIFVRMLAGRFPRVWNWFKLHDSESHNEFFYENLCDFVIENDGTLEDLEEQLNEIMEEIFTYA